MSDKFIDSIKKNEDTLKRLNSQDIVMLALSELMAEMAAGKGVPPGVQGKRICLSAELARRAGVRW